MPDNAIGYVDEGTPGAFKSPFPPALSEYGVTEDDWEKVICKKLRDTWGPSKDSTIAGIAELQESYFGPKKLHAVYAEYSLGVKAMTIYNDEEWQKLPE